MLINCFFYVTYVYEWFFMLKVVAFVLFFFLSLAPFSSFKEKSQTQFLRPPSFGIKKQKKREQKMFLGERGLRNEQKLMARTTKKKKENRFAQIDAKEERKRGRKFFFFSSPQSNSNKVHRAIVFVMCFLKSFLWIAFSRFLSNHSLRLRMTEERRYTWNTPMAAITAVWRMDTQATRSFTDSLLSLATASSFFW